MQYTYPHIDVKINGIQNAHKQLADLVKYRPQRIPTVVQIHAAILLIHSYLFIYLTPFLDIQYTDSRTLYNE